MMFMLKFLGVAVVLGGLALAPAHASTVQVLPGGCGTAAPRGGSDLIFTDKTGNVCQSGTTTTVPAALVPHNPDIATVTIGGTAVVAFSAGHIAKGGWLANPSTATVALCVSQTGTAVSSQAADTNGSTTCIAPGQSYTLAPGAGAVSVNATDSAHPFTGQGYY